MKNKGFTLVELIVVIAVMGILLAVVFPSVTRLQQNNQYKKFVSYGQSMVAAAKLYVDQYQEDLWGASKTENRTINQNDLTNANLLKPFQDKKSSCTGSVTVSRNNKKFTYTYQLNCGNIKCTGDSKYSTCTKDGSTVYEG